MIYEFVDKYGNKGKAIAKVSNIEKLENIESTQYEVIYNVNTSDTIMIYIIALVMASICIIITMIYERKNSIIEKR